MQFLIDTATKTLVLNIFKEGMARLTRPKKFEPNGLNMLIQQKLCRFLKPIFHGILHPKNYKFHELIFFTSSLNICSQFESSVNLA